MPGSCVQPAYRDLINATSKVAEVERLLKARSTAQNFKEPKGFAGLMMAAAGHVDGDIADNATINSAIVLAFIMGVKYDGS